MTDTLYSVGTRVRFSGGKVMSEVIEVPQQTQGVIVPATEANDPWMGEIPYGLIMVRWDHNDEVVPVFSNEVDKVL